MSRLSSFQQLLIMAVVVFAHAASAHEPRDKIVVIERADLRLPRKTVDTVRRGAILEVEKVNGDWLWVRGDKDVPGWLESQYVLSLEESLRHFNDAIREDSTDTHAYWAAGRVALELEQYDLALERYTQYISRRPKSAIAYNQRGDTWIAKGEYDKALADYNRSIELNPEYAAAYFNRGRTWTLKGDYDKALADYNRSIELDPKNAAAYVGRGGTWTLKGEDDKALADYDRAIQLDPKLALAYVLRGGTWDDKSEYDKAFADLDRAIELDPKLAMAYYERANTWYDKGEFDKAVADYDRAIQLDPKDATAYYNRGVTWGQKGELDKAHADFDRAIELDLKFASAFFNRGVAWEKKGEYDNSIADYNRAIEAGRRDKGIYAARGYCKFQLKQYDAAIDDLTEALRQDPKYVWALAKRAEVWEALGKRDRAAEDRRKAAAIDPEYALAELERIGAGKILERLRNVFPQGIAEGGDPNVQMNRELAKINAELAKHPENGQLYVSRAALRARSGNDDRAISDLDKAIELDSDNVEAWADRGEAHARKRNFSEARRDLYRAMKLSPQPRPCLMAVIGGIEFQEGRFRAALAALQYAVDTDATLHTAHHDLALQLATCPDLRFRDAEKAIHHATKACELTNWNYSNYLEMLAAAYAESGDFEKAVQWQEKAMQLANVLYDASNAADRLAEYKMARKAQLRHKRAAVVELIAPADLNAGIKVSVDGRDRGEQSKLTYSDIPHRGSVETTVKIVLPEQDQMQVEHRLMLKAGWRVGVPGVLNPAMTQSSPDFHRIQAVAFSHDGKKLLMGTDDAAFLFDSEAKSPLRQLRAGDGKVRGVAFSPDGDTALTAVNKEVNVIELSTGKVLQTIETKGIRAPSVDFGPTGEWFLTNMGRNSAAIWDAKTGEKLKEVTTSMLMSHVAAVDPKGRWLMLDATPQNYAMMWSLRRKGNTVADAYREVLTSLFADRYLVGGHRRATRSAAFSPDGSQLLTGGLDGKAILWAIDFVGKEAKVRDRTVRAPLQLRTFDGHPDELITVQFSHDGRQVLTATEEALILWDVKSGAQVCKFVATVAYSHNSAAFSPAGRFIAVADAGGVTFLDVATSECVAGLAVAKDGNGWCLLDTYGHLQCSQEWWDNWHGEKKNLYNDYWPAVKVADFVENRDASSSMLGQALPLISDAAPSYVLRRESWREQMKNRVAVRADERLALAHQHVAEEKHEKLPETIQPISWYFPEIVPARDADEATFEKIVMNEDRQNFDAFRFRTPAADVPWNLGWEFVIPAESSMQSWYIMPAEGSMQGFRRVDKPTKNLKVPDVELPEKNIHYSQKLHGGNLLPDREYLIWFDYAEDEPSAVYVKLWLSTVELVDVPPFKFAGSHIDPAPIGLSDSVRFDPAKHNGSLVIIRTHDGRYLRFANDDLTTHKGLPGASEIFQIDVPRIRHAPGLISIKLRSADGSLIQFEGVEDDSYLFLGPQKHTGGFYLLDNLRPFSGNAVPGLFGDARSEEEREAEAKNKLLVLHVTDDTVSSVRLKKLESDAELARTILRHPFDVYIVADAPER